VQQWCRRQFRQVARQPGGGEMWTAHGENMLAQQLRRGQSRPGARAVPHREVHVVLQEVDQLLVGADVNIDLGIPRLKVGQTRDQPVRGECRQHADGECSCAAKRRDATRDAVQRIMHHAGEGSTLLCQTDATPPAPEEDDAERLLQRFHLMADGAVSEVQFVRGTAEIAVPGSGFEHAECGKRRQWDGHDVSRIHRRGEE
jgi:hypothetical protein